MEAGWRLVRWSPIPLHPARSYTPWLIRWKRRVRLAAPASAAFTEVQRNASPVSSSATAWMSPARIGLPACSSTRVMVSSRARSRWGVSGRARLRCRFREEPFVNQGKPSELELWSTVRTCPVILHSAAKPLRLANGLPG